MVPVQKANGTVRICVDLTHLNKSVQREIQPMSSVDESLAKLGNSRVFSKIDANSLFWQIPLDEESITPVNDLNHATWSIRLQSTTIRDQFRSGDIPATSVPNSWRSWRGHMSHGWHSHSRRAEHDKRMRAVLGRIQEAGLTLNTIKCQFSKNLSDVPWAHHRWVRNLCWPTETNSGEKLSDSNYGQRARKVHGYGKPNGEINPRTGWMQWSTTPTTANDNVWSWSDAQDRSFQRVKDILIAPETLAHYDPNRPTIIAADASSTGIGTPLRQV